MIYCMSEGAPDMFKKRKMKDTTPLYRKVFDGQ